MAEPMPVGPAGNDAEPAESDARVAVGELALVSPPPLVPPELGELVTDCRELGWVPVVAGCPVAP